MTTPEHEHRWVPDNARTGFSCMDCHASGWDWHVGEVRRLRAEVKAQGEAIEAARQEHEEGCTELGASSCDVCIALNRLGINPQERRRARLDAATAAETPARE